MEQMHSTVRRGNLKATRTAALWVAGLGFVLPVSTIAYFVRAMNTSGYPAGRGNLICGFAFMVLVAAQAAALLLGIGASTSRTAKTVMAFVAVPLLLWVTAAFVVLVWQVSTGAVAWR